MTNEPPSSFMSDELQSILIFAGVLALICAGIFVILVMRQKFTGPVSAKGLLAIKGAAGPTRCMLILEHLNILGAKGNQGLIMADWEALEMPLLEAVPDCPPGLKKPLILALEKIHGQISNRAYQHRIMDVRNSLA